MRKIFSILWIPLILCLLGTNSLNAAQVTFKINDSRGYSQSSDFDWCKFSNLSSTSSAWSKTTSYDGDLSTSSKTVIKRSNSGTYASAFFDWFTLKYYAPSYTKIKYTLYYQLGVESNTGENSVRAAYFNYDTDSNNRWSGRGNDPSNYSDFRMSRGISDNTKTFQGESKAIRRSGSGSSSSTWNTITVTVDNSSGSSETNATRYGGFASTRGCSDDGKSHNNYTYLYMYYGASTTYYWYLTYKANGGTGNDIEQTITSTDNFKGSTTFSRTGYTFSKWNTKSDGTGTSYTAGSSCSSSSTNKGHRTLYAIWTANTYTVTFDRQSGTGGDGSATATYDSNLPTITPPTRTGYTFQGYYTSANGQGSKYYNADGTGNYTWRRTSGITLYAYWTANTYTITLDKQDGIGGDASVTATYGAAMPTITIPTQLGYEFGGYYANVEDNVVFYYDKDGKSAHVWDILSNTTLYAQWNKTHYVPITLDAKTLNGDVVMGKNQTIDQVWSAGHQGYGLDGCAAFYSNDCNNVNSAQLAYGMPSSNIVKSPTDENVPFNFTWTGTGQFDGNDAIHLVSYGEKVTVNLDGGNAFMGLYFQATAGNVFGSSSPIYVTITYVDGTTTQSNFNILDWYQNAIPANAIHGYKRYERWGGPSGNAQGPNLYCLSLNDALNPTKPIKSMTFTQNNSSMCTGIFAITGVLDGRVPQTPQNLADAYEGSTTTLTFDEVTKDIDDNIISDVTYVYDAARDANFIELVDGHTNQALSATITEGKVTATIPANLKGFYIRVRALNTYGASQNSDAVYTEGEVFTVIVIAPDYVASKVSKGGNYKENETVTLSTPATITDRALDFKYWADADGNQISTDNPYSFTITQNVTVQPIYQLQDGKYIVTIADVDNCTIAGLQPYGIYDSGANASLRTYLKPDYTFVRWENNDGDSLSNTNPLIITITKDTVLKPIIAAENLTPLDNEIATITKTNDDEYPWLPFVDQTHTGLSYRSSNQSQKNTTSTSTLTITPQTGVAFYHIEFDYEVHSEENNDELTLWVNGEEVESIYGTTSKHYQKLNCENVTTIKLQYAKNDETNSDADCGYIYNLTVTSSVYTRPATNGYWGTICLPWASLKLEGATFYNVLGTKDDEQGVALTGIEEPNQLEAGKAYVFKATSDLIKVTYDPTTEVEDSVYANNHIYGSFAGCTVPVDNYIIYNNLLYITDGSSTIGANRAYFDVEEMDPFVQSQAPARVVFFGGRQAPTDNPSLHHSINSSLKVLQDGQFRIVRDGKTYNAQGQRIQ